LRLASTDAFLGILYRARVRFLADTMSSFANRSPHLSSLGDRLAAAWRSDGGLLIVLGLFWLVSVIRCVGGLLRHEVFGAEATLALMAIVGLPWLVAGRPGRTSFEPCRSPVRRRYGATKRQ
jgi:hypothetical protein